MNVTMAKTALQRVAHPERVAVMQRFFKTGPGEYAEEDLFIGAYVPDIRKIAKRCKDFTMSEIQQLLHSHVHEERLLALIILVNACKKGNNEERERIYTFYMNNMRHVNHWDLVDVSAEHIVGGYLFDKDTDILFELAQSVNVWSRRIAVMATFYFIKRGRYDETIALAKLLLKDSHDLIHKAVGWMLREIGKRDYAVAIAFLDEYAQDMPRTMLRYAIEKLPAQKRKIYLEQ